ncbi:U2 small nuclear ribonucleoprotein A' [Candida viswanathii]|uniref:U2 small nuclear ribonucleoprotein A' n=1 Tax=Candida viswanathii TaxID=5486 RepID=A0A367XRD7_9ASCO|nr:U2 small nuclear ribonucleoprotein A' [Candida viswanathii]
MRLTSQLINDAPIILNPEGKLTILLRDLGLTELENLSITNDKFQVIDLSNNDLIKLSNIPPNFNKLEDLLLSNNNILYIDDDAFPLQNQIKSITLYNNNIYKFQANFKDKFPKLETLVLIGNPITELENYRLFIIWLIPSLKVLDFKKVKQSERQQGEELFGQDHTVFNKEASKLLSKTGDASVQNGKVDKQVNNVVKKLTEEEKQELLKKLEVASSIEEIEKIESALKSGIV